MEKFAGVWSTCPVDDGGAVDQQLVLLPSGAGAFVEYNWFLCGFDEIIWDITDDNILTVKSAGGSVAASGSDIFFSKAVVFVKNVELEGITGKKEIFDCFRFADNDAYYRIRSDGDEIEDFLKRIREEALHMGRNNHQRSCK